MKPFVFLVLAALGILPGTARAQYGSIQHAVASGYFSANDTQTPLRFGLFGQGQPNETIVGFEFALPAGFSFAGDVAGPALAGQGGEPESKPTLGATGTLVWSYAAPPAESASAQFQFQVTHAAGAYGTQGFTGYAVFRTTAGVTTKRLLTPVPLQLRGAATPVISSSPASQTVVAGAAVTFEAQVPADSIYFVNFQWMKDGVAIAGATGTRLSLSNVRTSDAGAYAVVASNPVGATATSASATLTVTAPSAPGTVDTPTPSSSAIVAPAFVRQPGDNGFSAAVTCTAAGALTLGGAFSVSGTAPIAYQWLKDGVAIAGATGLTFAKTTAQLSDGGAYALVAMNSAGSATSRTIAVTVTPAARAPAITTQPLDRAIAAGTAVSFSVAADTDGLPASYQWQKNSQPIAGATSSVLTIVPQPTDADTYSVTVTTSAGSVTSRGATPTALYSRFVNLSARGQIARGDGALITGFVVAGTATKTLVLRAIGPTLTQFGVTAALAQPQLTFTNATGQVIGSNSAWGGGSELAAVFVRTGAFPLAANTRDAALLSTNAAGGYSAVVRGMDDTTGIALAEIYDTEAARTATARLVNLSVRGNVGVGDGVLIAGFGLEGNVPKTVLVRGIGPTLAQFGVADPLARPQLALFDSAGRPVGSNAAWGGNATLADAFARSGAFALSPTSADTAVVISLPPGTYSAQIAGAAGGTGMALLEIYEVP